MNVSLVDVSLSSQVRRLHRSALVAIGIIAAMVIGGVLLVEGKSRWLLHTRHVLRVLNEAERRVEAVVVDGARIDDRLAGADDALLLFDSLATLTADNPLQVSRIRAARAAAVARVDAAAAIRARAGDGPFANSPERQRLAASIGQIREAEQALYDARTSEQRFWRYIMVTCTLGALALLAYTLRRFQGSTLTQAGAAAAARADLDETQQRLAFVLERSPLAVAVVRSDGRTDVHSAKWSELVGAESLAIGASTHPVASELARLVARVRESHGTEVSELTIDTSAAAGSAVGSAAQVWTASAYALEPRDAGRATAQGAVGVVLADITPHRTLETRLRHSQRLESIGRLAGGVAHDFNNILTAILGFTELVRYRLPEDGRAKDDLLQVTSAAERATMLTRQLLAFSRQQLVQPRALDTGEVVLSLEPMLRRLIGSHITVHVSGDRPLWAVRADRGQLEQVVVNLVLNARDAMPNGGEVHIATHNVQQGDGRRCVSLSVRDTGVGIPEAHRVRIFEPFFTTKAPGQGTGLGLSTVQSIVQQCEAHIAVESAEGRGTKFTVSFPVHDGPVEEVVQVLPSRVAARAADVVVVDDDRDVRQLMEYALSEAGYRVVTFGTGTDALVHLRRLAAPPDLVVSDLVMRGMGGFELERQLAADGVRVPFLFVSGYSEEQHNALTSGQSNSPILSKPFTPNELLAAVAAQLAPLPQ
jgi:signal transduction histidine kinase/CheY-like chemotaxis protein